jgi:hypothetical protein
VLVANHNKPPDWVKVPAEIVTFTVEVTVPPCMSRVPELVIPAVVAVPFVMVNVPFVFTVIKPEAVNAPEELIVSLPPEPVLFIEIVVTLGTVPEITG